MKPTLSDEQKVQKIREDVPAVQAVAYFNAGTNGPVPRASHNAMLEEAERELVEGRIAMEGFKRYLAAMDESRAVFASMLGCSADEVALTHNTTEGMNIALMGIDWQPRDEIVTATTEHPGGLYPCLLLHQRYGVTVRTTQIGAPEVDPIEALQRALTPRTRAVALSHVSWSSGRVLPMREIADLAHAAGALLICDAAQSCGMVPSSVYDLGVDAYACSGQKWLCGPQGTGGLFVRSDRFSTFGQTFMGYFGAEHHDLEGHFIPPAAARRYEYAMNSAPTVAGLLASLRWLSDEVGWDWIFARIATLGRDCYDRLEQIPGVSVHTPHDAMAGLVHFTVEGVDPAEVTKQLSERDILIRDLHDFGVNRVSTGFYNTHAEIDRLTEAVAALALA